ncbi:MAG: hypothetical protein ACI4IR_02500 [Eubacterium sp.]
MEFIKEWTLTVSVTLIISIIFSVLSPKGNMGRYFKIILAMFIFTSFIYPLSGADMEFDFPVMDEMQYEDTRRETYENIICADVKSTLESGGYTSSKVTASIKYSENEITVKELSIGITDNFDKDEVKKYVSDQTGFNAEVYYLGE